MAKKKASDPVIDALMESLQSLFTACVCHAMEVSGPQLARKCMEGLKCQIENQMKELEELTEELVSNGQLPEEHL